MSEQTQKRKGAEKALGDWIRRQKVTIKLWLYRRALLAALGFIALNAVDAHLTNWASRQAQGMGIAQSIEANPILQPIVGTWALSFKGLLGAGVIGLFGFARHLSPDRLCFWFLLGCLVMIGVIFWNMYSTGIFG